MKSDILVETRNLSVTFPMKKESIFERRKYLKAVSDVSLQIMKGETFGLVGESGCGKSTFANTTLCFEKLSGGELYFDGVDLTNADRNTVKTARRRMQKIFQDPASSLNPRFTVYDAISEPLKIRGYDAEKARELTVEMTCAVGLGKDDLKRYTSEFSGGQQQRIAIARALILKPEYIVCDEPVSALDVSVHAQILNLLMEMQEKTGAAYLFISHNLAVVKRICSRLAIMYLGKVVEYGDAAKIFENPLHPYTRALLSAVLPMDDKKAGERIILQGDTADATAVINGCCFRSRCPRASKECGEINCELAEAEEGHMVACPFAGK